MGEIKIYGEIRVDRDGGHIEKERLKESNKGLDQSIIWGCEGCFGTYFLHSSCETSYKLKATFTFYLTHSFFSLPILCCYSPRLCVTHPLTLELKFSPPPLLICSLHYSFIIHLCSLCSASMSLFLFIPLL